MKIPSQLQNMIEDWCKSINITLENKTDEANKEKDTFDFFLQGGQAGKIYNFEKVKDRDDRVTITSAVKISQIHQDAFANLSAKDQAQFMQSINEYVSLSNCQIHWVVKDGKPTALMINDYVDVDEFTRHNLFKTLDKVVQTKSNVVGKFQVEFNPNVTATDVSASTDTNPMYS